MASIGMSGKGTTLGHGATAIATPTLIAQVRKVSGPNRSVKSLDITNADSPGNYEEVVPGTIAPGDMTFDIVYAKAGRAAMEALLGVAAFWTVTYPDGSTDKFAGFVNKLGQESPHDNVITCSCGIAVSGVVTFAPAA